MSEEFSCNGLWWFPDNPEQKKWCGTLKYDPEKGATLILTDVSRKIHDLFKSKFTGTELGIGYQEIILGTSPSHGVFTLYKCYCEMPPLVIRYTGPLILRFNASVIFRHAHFQKTDDIIFRKLLVNYTHLFEWVGISGIDVPLDSEVLRGLDEVITLKCPNIPPVEVEDFTISIDFRYHRPHPIQYVREEASFKQIDYIAIESPKKEPLAYFERVINYLRNFLSLGVMVPVQFRSIRGYTLDEQMESGVEILYKLQHNTGDVQTIQFYEMLFSFEDISCDFGLFLNNWFSKAEKLQPVCDLYFGVLYNPRTYLIHIFLSFVQALETYYVRCQQQHRLPEDEREVLIEAVLSRPDNKYKENTLKRKDPILFVMLLELLHCYSDTIHPFIWSNSHIDFAQQVVVTRHYYTHYDPKLKSVAAKGNDLFSISMKLRLLLQLCFLFEIGFSLNKIGQLLRDNKSYGRFLMLLDTDVESYLHDPFRTLG